jgi:hypothetical protein
LASLGSQCVLDRVAVTKPPPIIGTLAAVRIDLVGTTADFRRFGLPRPLQVNHLPCENCAMLGRIGEVGLMLVTAGSAEGRCFVLRLPANGNSNAG